MYIYVITSLFQEQAPNQDFPSFMPLLIVDHIYGRKVALIAFRQKFSQL